MLTTPKTFKEDSVQQTPRAEFNTLTREDAMHLTPSAGSIKALNRDTARHQTPVGEHNTPRADGDNSHNRENDVHWTPKGDKLSIQGPRSKGPMSLTRNGGVNKCFAT